jgi:DUF4097 and DUF4098 domain-containing protein YvlB
MTNANYTTSTTPQLTIICHADLQIVGTADNLVVIDIEDDSPASRVERKDDVVSITAMNDCDISCPIGTALTIEHVSGDLRVTQVTGSLAINAVNGDAVLKDVGAVAIKTVQGDLTVRSAEGDVQTDIVRGDATLKRVAGSVAINKVAGNLVVDDLGGGLAVNTVNGDATLETALHSGQIYVTKASGDVTFRVKGGGGQFTLNCRGDLRVRVPMANWTGNDRSGAGLYGEGTAQVTLVANGDLLVLPAATGSPVDADQISGQVEALIELAMSQFETQMSKVQHDLEQRFGKLDKHTEKAAERAARSAERAKRRAEHAAGSWSFSFGRPPTPPTPPSEPVSDQERLLILKMVEEGKIDVDQAAQLLSALES